MTEALIVFAKPPRAGRVKTRLTALISEEEAAALYAAFLEDALEQYEALGATVRLYLALDDTDARDLSIHPRTFKQQGEGLGPRMLHAFAETFAAGFERAIVIGTDHPTLPPTFIVKAFELLRAPRSVVIGPADDGGYYLLGMNDLRPELFRDMRYSHGDVFEQTLRRAADSQAQVSVLPTWYDVDTPDGLRRLIAELADSDIDARRTRDVAEDLQRKYPGLAEMERL